MVMKWLSGIRGRVPSAKDPNGMSSQVPTLMVAIGVSSAQQERKAVTGSQLEGLERSKGELDFISACRRFSLIKCGPLRSMRNGLEEEV